ncbi:hypothetical protein EV401DRAFT_1887659 [Pisolithus croceorrhizus]|nr:hypothetical protein EV401DRAFT_1887659 [Pisolithus croceorrhizus]
MSEQQQWRVHFYHQDDGSSSSESRSEAPHCPSMEGSASVDQSINTPTPPGGGSVDRMAAMHSVLIPTPPGTATTPHMDRMDAMCRATIPTPPAGSPAPRMDRMVAMCNATILPPPACMPATQTDKMVAMQSVAIPLPPVASAALPPQPLPINNLERMKMAVILIPPSMAPAPNMDQLERMHNATIPHAPSSRMEMMDAQPQPSLNTDHPQQCTSTEVTDSQRQPCTITGEDINQGEEPDCSCTVDFGTPNCRQLQDLLLNAVAGDVPTLEECQALEQVELATSDADDDLLLLLILAISFACASHIQIMAWCWLPPSNIPYNKDLDGHIMWAMWWISADIQHLVRSQVQHVEAGQYTVDMIDLLEVSQHPHVGYSLQSYTGGPPYPSQQSTIEMAIVYLGCRIECAVIHLLEGAGSPHTGDHITGKLLSIVASMFPCIPVMPRGPGAISGLGSTDSTQCLSDDRPDIPLHSKLDAQWVDRSPQYHAEFQQMRGVRIFPIAHEYFQHTWPLQWLSVGDQIDEWMEENVSAYMIAARSVAVVCLVKTAWLSGCIRYK